MARPSWKSKIRIPSSLAIGISTQSFLVLALKIIVFAAAIVVFYFQDLILVFTNAVNDEATSYILMVPIVFTYLIYRKRRMLLAAVTYTTQNLRKHEEYYIIPSGILLCLAAIILYWHGSFTFSSLEYHLATVPIFTAGLALILFNPQMLRQALFPIAFLIFLMPPPSEILYNIGSLVSVFVGVLFITYIVRDSAWKKAVVFTIVFPLIYILNIVRIKAIIAIGYSMGEQLALDIFYLLSGWVLILIGTFLLLAIGGRILKINLFSNRHKQTCPDCISSNAPTETRNHCAHCGRILKHPITKLNTKDAARLAITIATALLLLSIQIPVLALIHSVPSVIISTTNSEQGNTQLFPQINDYNIQYIYRDTAFESTSQQDYSIIFEYTPTSESKPPVWITLEIANATSALHRWESTLARAKITTLVLENIQILDNPPIKAWYFAFQYLTDNKTQLVLYWYETSVFTISNVAQQKYVKLSLISYPETPQDVPEMQSHLLPIAQEIAKYWQPLKASVFVSFLISQHGLELATATIIVLIVLISFYVFEVRRQKRARLSVYEKLGTREQQLVATVRKIQKTSIPTLDRVTETYNQNSGATLTTEQLQQKLVDLEKVNVIQSVICNNRDEPVKTWKA